MAIAHTVIELTRDDRGFIYVDGIKFGRLTNEGLEIIGCDRRIPNSPKKRVVVPINQLLQILGTPSQE